MTVEELRAEMRAAFEEWVAATEPVEQARTAAQLLAAQRAFVEARQCQHEHWSIECAHPGGPEYRVCQECGASRPNGTYDHA